MKKIVLGVLLMTGFALASQAQKGSVLVYGNLAVGTEKDVDDNKMTSFSIFPGVGYQFDEHWTAGVTGGYGQSKFNPEVGADIKASQYAAGVFGRYTHPLGGIFSLYGQLDATYQGRKDAASNKYSGFNFSLTPAIALNVKNGFALNFGFGGIQFETEKLKDASNSSTFFSVNFGEQFNIGISKNFGGRK